LFYGLLNVKFCLFVSVIAYEELSQPRWGGVFNTLLLLLQLMHVYWFVLIVRTTVRVLRVGRFDRDIRSDDDDNTKESKISPSPSTTSSISHFTFVSSNSDKTTKTE
jgi:hypothetical protein